MGKINGKHDSAGVKSCYWIYVETFFHIKNSSCPLFVERFLGVTLFEAQCQTLTQLDMLVFTSANTSLTGVKMHCCKCGSPENKSAAT